MPHSFPTRRSSDLRNIIDTISCLEAVAYTVICMEETGMVGPCDETVERVVRDFRPDIVILIPSIRFFDRMPSRQCLERLRRELELPLDRKSTRLNSSH